MNNDNWQMTNDKCDLSIVIVSYNVRDLLAQCLNSVFSIQSSVFRGQSQLNTKHRTLNIEVFVVDNASRDGSAAMVRERFPAVRLIENSENRGFAAANNQAFIETRRRYVMMLNPDTQLKPGALETLVRFMDANPRAGACGGKLQYGDGSFQHSAFAFPTLAQIFLDFFPLNWRLTNSRLNGRYPREWYARGEPFQVDHPLGADFLVRREVAEQVGWLDDQFFIYCEEIDWAIRIKRAGWQIWCVPQAEIVHHEAQSTQQFRDAMFVELWRARKRLFEKHYSRVFRFAARQIVRAGLANEARKARAARLTLDELKKRLDAYARVRDIFKR
ncbi:N-acetylglucosaminyl-diphospho-decaprenol L-rhamnosyltransferase [Anaerolineae bacterium]|nr:N-acetylglucosaminyl-diphospho-decaprenol L-rhamnosyltransferase [Anaerolineae bacterium]